MAKRVNMSVLVVVLVVVAATIHCAAAQIVHVVGGDIGWGVPDAGFITYATWVATQNFTVGDILEFNFTTGNSDVAHVTREAFLLCNTSAPMISLTTTGPANITLNTTGEYYFFCTFSGRCGAGQRLVLNVTGASSPAPKSAPTPAPSRSPINYTVGDGMGWLVPLGGPIAYQTWAFNKTFLVGDTLVFNFTEKVDDVAEVTKTAFNTCDTNTNTTISTYTTSPARITLTRAGEHFYTSTFPNRCILGQQLAINVTGTSTATPPSSTPTPSPTPSAQPPSSNTAPPPTPGSHAPSFTAAAGFSATFLSIVVAYLLY